VLTLSNPFWGTTSLWVHNPRVGDFSLPRSS